MNKKRFGKSVASKTSLMAIIMIIAGTVIIGVYGYFSFRSEVIAANGQKALLLAESVASYIDGDEMASTMQNLSPGEHWDDTKSYIDDVKTSTGVQYIYIIDQDGQGSWRYFMDAQTPDDPPENIGQFGDTDDPDAFPAAAQDAYNAGSAIVSDIYDSEGYGIMLTGFAPVADSSGNTAGIVGVDISIDEVNRSTGIFGLFTIVIIAAFSILAGLLFMRYVNRIVGRPIKDLSRASNKIAHGDLDISLEYSSEDEIGELTDSFHQMVDSTASQAETMDSIANGDLTVRLASRGEHDSMYRSMKKMINNLKDLVGRISTATEQVLTGSRQLADGAGVLAQGSIEQTTAVSNLSHSISGVTEQTVETTKMAGSAAELAYKIQTNAKEGTDEMKELTRAVEEIGDAGNAINKIIKVIDDIAFQTNILALNAAVEAARAGQHGAGFAVVADEVRNLAAKSAEAARETSVLISNSIEKSEFGAEIALKTAESLDKIVNGIEESHRIIQEIASLTKSQSDTIIGINEGIDKVSEVVQQNTATAQQSSAASQEMSGQSEVLRQLVSRFRVD